MCANTRVMQAVCHCARIIAQSTVYNVKFGKAKNVEEEFIDGLIFVLDCMSLPKQIGRTSCRERV